MRYRNLRARTHGILRVMKKNEKKTARARKGPQRIGKKERRKWMKTMKKITPFELDKWGLCLPPEGILPFGRRLKAEDQEQIRKTWGVQELEKNLRGMIDVTEKEFPEKELVEKMREKVILDYTGTVLCEKLRPNPEPRGRFGYAYIPLKVDAVPTQQRPFSMHGIREEAYKKLSRLN